MHIFSMFTEYMQGLKTINWKLWQAMITPTLYAALND